MRLRMDVSTLLQVYHLTNYSYLLYCSRSEVENLLTSSAGRKKMQGTLVDLDIRKARLDDFIREAEKARRGQSVKRLGLGTSLKNTACSINLLSETHFCTKR